MLKTLKESVGKLPRSGFVHHNFYMASKSNDLLEVSKVLHQMP